MCENHEKATGNRGVNEISYELKQRALELFKSGYGYKKVSSETGIKLFTPS